MPTKSQRVDFIMIAQSRLEQCRSFMDPVFNNLLIAYTIKLSKQLGEFRKVLSVIEKSGSVDVIAKSFKPVDNVGRREARDFLSFFLKSKLAFDQLKLRPFGFLDDRLVPARQFGVDR